MNIPLPKPLRWVARLVATLACAGAIAQSARAPQIENIAIDGLGARVTVSVPTGARRIVLESTRRGDLTGWSPRAVRRLDGTAQTVVIDIAADAPNELLRVRADDSDPLPAAFYKGTTNITPSALPGGGTLVALRNGNMVYDSAGPAQPPAVEGNNGGGAKTVTESDIWKIRGSRLYFFNQLRGLQSIDVSQPDAPALLGTLSFPASGEQLYAPDDQHVVLLLREDCRGNGYSGAAIVLVDVSAAQPREVARLAVPGRLFESRMIGSALYVASQTYENTDPKNGIWQLSTVVSSFDLANPAAPVARSSRKVPGAATVVTAAGSYFFVGLDVSSGISRATQLHVLDVSADDGSIAEFANLKLTGWIRDKFKLHLQGDVLRLVVEDQEHSDRWSPFTRLTTWRLARDGKDNYEALGKLDLGAGENLYGTRFDGDRAYVVTFRRIDPLWIVDLSDPTQPKVMGELKIPGWSNYLHPLGDRLLTVGIDDTAGWRASVQLFDVADPAKPALLSKVSLGDQWSWTEANDDEKALGVFPEDGLVLLPFTGSGGESLQQGVQILDLAKDTLKSRGFIAHAGLTPRRSTVLGARVLSLSARELLTVDIANRDLPKVTSELGLSRRVDRVVAARQHLLTFADTDLQVASVAAPDTVLATVPLGKLPVIGAATRGDFLYVLQGAPAVVLWTPDATGNQWIPSTNAGSLQLRVLSLAQLPVVTETGLSTSELSQTSASDFEALWPTDNTVVWASRNSGSYFGPWLLDTTMRLAPAPAPSVATLNSPGSIAFDSRAAMPVIADRFWPGFWWGGQPQSLFAFDVTDPAHPAYKSAVASDPKAVRTSSAHRGDGLVLFSEEFQESSIVGTNEYTWTESTYTLVTNTVWKTNITAIPIQEWITNATKEVQAFPGLRASWPGSPALPVTAAGAFHSLLLDGTQNVWSWGDTAARISPDGTRRNPAVPEKVPGSGAFKAVSAGTYHSLGLDADRAVWSWLSVDLLTTPPTPDEATPVSTLDTAPKRVAGLPPADFIAAGHRHSLAVANQRVWAWGHNAFGQLGREIADADLPPAEIAGVTAKSVAAGAYHSLVLQLDGSVVSFGRNDHLQLGGKPDRSTLAPLPVPLPGPATAVAAGAYHGVALLADGSVWSWGSNQEGQLGRSQEPGPSLPSVVPGLPLIRSIAAGAFYTLALDDSGSVWIWGQIDPSLGEARRSPGQITSRRDFAAVSAGRNHALLTTASGETITFGASAYGQLGAGADEPVEAVFLIENLVYQPVYTYVTNVGPAEEVRSVLTTRDVTNSVPIYKWWQRHELRVVDYAAGGADPVVRPSLAFPGELRGASLGGNLLFSFAQKSEGDTNVITRDVLEVSAYDGVNVFVGGSLTLATNGDSTSYIHVTPDSHVLVAQSSWSTPDSSKLRVFGLADARFTELTALGLPSTPQETRLIGNTLMIRGAGTFQLWDVSAPASPSAIPSVDHGCVWFNLSGATGSPESGWWAPGGEYGTLFLGPR